MAQDFVSQQGSVHDWVVPTPLEEEGTSGWKLALEYATWDGQWPQQSPLIERKLLGQLPPLHLLLG